MSERGLDPVRWIDIPMHHPPPQRLGGHVDQLDLVSAARYLIGQGLVLRHAGDLFRHVAERLEVLDIQGGDDVDARVEQLVDVLPPLAVPAAGHVGVGELVHQRDLGVASEHRVQVHLGEGRAAVAHRAPRHLLQSLGHRRSQPAAVSLKERDNHVRAPRPAPLAFAEHRVGLPDTGRCAEINAELSPCHIRHAPRTLSREAGEFFPAKRAERLICPVPAHGSEQPSRLTENLAACGKAPSVRSESI